VDGRHTTMAAWTGARPGGRQSPIRCCFRDCRPGDRCPSKGVVRKRDDEDTGPTPWLIYRWSQLDRRIFLTVVHSPGRRLEVVCKVWLIWLMRSPYFYAETNSLGWAGPHGVLPRAYVTLWH
jgi:hypothetical protein